MLGVMMALGLGITAVGPTAGPYALRNSALSHVTTKSPLVAPDYWWMRTRVVWQNLVGVTATGNSLTKTAAGGSFDAGASSVQVLYSGDGYVEFTTAENGTSKQIGLSNGDPGATAAEIDFSLRLGIGGNLVTVFESGVNMGIVDTYVPGDVFRVGIESGIVTYRKNGVLIYESAGVPTYPLIVDTSLNTQGATLTQVFVAAPPKYPVRWTNAVGVRVEGNRITKTAADGTGNAGAASVQALTGGDGYVSVIGVANDTSAFFGLGTDDSPTDPANIEFAILLTGDPLAQSSVYESGVWKADIGFGTAGVEFRVCVERGRVVYRRDGVLVYTSTASTMYPLRVGSALVRQARSISAKVAGMRLCTMHEMDMDLGGWGGDPLTPDLLITPGISMEGGISGAGPLDLTASTGRMSWALANHGENSEGTLGLYSPQHVDCRSGFELGRDVRYLYRSEPTATPVLKFVGRLKSVDPESNVHGTRRVQCGAVDWMDEAANTKISVPVQVGKRSDECLTTLLGAIQRQPEGTDFDTGNSVFPYAFDSSKSEKTSALAEIQRINMSEFGRTYLRRGVLRHENRTARLAPLSTVIFDGTMRSIEGGLSSSKVKNSAKVTVHPRRVDAAATTVLFSKPDESNPGIDPSASITITGRYNDPAARANRVGGMDMVTPVATTDYLMNAAEDGSGADLTADVEITATYGSSQVDYIITNTGGTKGYITKLQARGRGIYDYDPMDAVARNLDSIARVGENVMTLDMPYQSDLAIAQPIAQFLIDVWLSEGVSESSMEFQPRDEEELEIAMGIESGDAIVAIEELTGISDAFFVQRWACSIEGPGATKTTFRWSLQRALVADFWLLGSSGYSELGVTTILGPL